MKKKTHLPKKQLRFQKKFAKSNIVFRFMMHSQNFTHEYLYFHIVCCWRAIDTHAGAHRMQWNAEKKVCFYLVKRWKTDEFSIRFQHQQDFLSIISFLPRNAKRAYICNWRWILKLTSENYENTFALQSHLHDLVCKLNIAFICLTF